MHIHTHIYIFTLSHNGFNSPTRCRNTQFTFLVTYLIILQFSHRSLSQDPNYAILGPFIFLIHFHFMCWPATTRVSSSEVFFSRTTVGRSPLSYHGVMVGSHQRIMTSMQSGSPSLVCAYRTTRRHIPSDRQALLSFHSVTNCVSSILRGLTPRPLSHQV